MKRSMTVELNITSLWMGTCCRALQFTCHLREFVSGPAPAQHRSSPRRWDVLLTGTINPENVLLYITKQLWKDWVQIFACHLSHLKIDPFPTVRRFSDSAFPKPCLSGLPADWLLWSSWSVGLFPTQGSNLGLLHCRRILYHLNHQIAHGDRDGIKGEEGSQTNPSFPTTSLFLEAFSIIQPSVLQHSVPGSTHLAHLSDSCFFVLLSDASFFASYLWHLRGVCPFGHSFKKMITPLSSLCVQSTP